MSRLLPPPPTPNCVSSRVEPSHPAYVAPIRAPFDAVRAALLALPRSELAEAAEGYARVVVQTAVFRFRDDVEIEADGDVVHVRSASRVGHSDLGVNRRRVEALRRAAR